MSFIVHKPDDTDENQYLIDNRDATSDGMRIMQRSDADGNYRFSMDSTNVNSASGSVTTNETLLTAIQSSTAATLFKNAVQQATAADDAISVTAAFRIGANRVSTGTYFDGTMKEIILFTSDQTDNRFKIESNINNYYGLYNDENEFSGNPTAEVTPSAITLTNESKTGFTAVIDATSGTKQVVFPFVNDLVSGDDYFVSFDYTTSNSSKTVSVKPFQSAGGSNASNDTISATSTGFYRGTGDASHNGFDVNAIATVLVFQTTGTSFNFTVSNLKVSRIARNGFVETWYDQSGSGNNATQTTASKQPKIVSSGTIIKNVKGFPSVKFESANSTQLDIGKIIDNINSASAYVVQQKDTGDTSRLAGFAQGTSSNNSRFYLTFYGSNGSLPNFGYNDEPDKISFGTTATGTCNMYSAFSGDTNIEAFKNGSSVGTTALVDQANTTTNSKIGAISSSFLFDGNISEIFITTKKLQDDAATINSDVTSYYNL